MAHERAQRAAYRIYVGEVAVLEKEKEPLRETQRPFAIKRRTR